MPTPSQPDDFDLGKEIFEKLKDLTPERQQRILRWVSEGLGIVLPTITSPPPQPAVAQISPQKANIPIPGGPPCADIKTFIAAKAPKSDQQFAAAVAYYYRFEAPPAARRDSIDGELLQEATRLAGRSRLSKPRNTLNNAKKAGYLDSNGPGIFTINSVGENLVAMTLPGGGEKPTRPVKKKKAKTKKMSQR